MRPNFKNIDIKNAGFAAHNAAEWAKANGIEADWKTPEHIQVKPVYTKYRLCCSIHGTAVLSFIEYRQ